MFICLLWFCHGLPKREIVRTYVIHLLGTYVTILCNWLNPLTKRTLLVFGYIQDEFNTSRNFVSRSSVKTMRVCPRNKLKKCLSLKLDSCPSIKLKKLFQPHESTATRQQLDRQAFVEVYEKQSFSSVLTPIRDYVFGLSFLTTLDMIILRAIKEDTSCTSVEQSLFKQIMTEDRICPSSSFL